MRHSSRGKSTSRPRKHRTLTSMRRNVRPTIWTDGHVSKHLFNLLYNKIYSITINTYNNSILPMKRCGDATRKVLHTTFSVHDDQVIEEQINRAYDRIGITVSGIFPPADWPLLPLACIPNTIASNPPRHPFAIATRALPIPPKPRLQILPGAKRLHN